MSNYNNHVIISEVGEQEETLYEVTFHGIAEDFGFDDSTDYLSAPEAEEIAKDVASDMNSTIVWECSKPSGYAGIEI
jgi:hypothetical protein